MLTGFSSPIRIIGSSTMEGQSLSKDVYKMESINDDFPHFAKYQTYQWDWNTITNKYYTDLIGHDNHPSGTNLNDSKWFKILEFLF